MNKEYMVVAVKRFVFYVVRGIKMLSLSVMLILLFFTNVYSATYYVRNDGSDTICNGQTDAPGASAPNCAYLTIPKGIDSAYAGDTVMVHSGTYLGSTPNKVVSVRSGTSGNPITIKAYPGDIVSTRMWGLGHNYIVLDGFQINDPRGDRTSAGVYITGSYNTVKNTYIYNYYQNTAAYAMYIVGSYNTISNNIVDGLNKAANRFHIGFDVEGVGNTFSKNVIKNLVDMERIWNLGGTSNVIRGNEVYNCLWTGNPAVHPDIFQWISGVSRNHIIENNYFHDMNAQIGINEATAADSYGWTFKNNVFANIDQRAMLNHPNTKWYNNTFYRVSGNGEGASVNVVDINTSVYPTGHEFKNNIVIGATTLGGYGMLNLTGPASGLNISNNYWGTPSFGARTQATIEGYGDKNYLNGGDPQFVAAFTNCTINACDFHLKPGSPLIGKGVPLSSFSYDIVDTIRPKDSAWTIGAYESIGINKKPFYPSIIFIGD